MITLIKYNGIKEQLINILMETSEAKTAIARLNKPTKAQKDKAIISMLHSLRGVKMNIEERNGILSYIQTASAKRKLSVPTSRINGK